MQSLWDASVQMPSFHESLPRDKTDVLIIGGGLAGLLCAYRLAQAGIDYILVDADRICSGITGNTTAKITSQHGMIYSELISRYGTVRARMYYDANERALTEYRRMCNDIPCDFEEKRSFVYSLSDRKKCEDEASALLRLKIPMVFDEHPPIPFPSAAAVGFDRQAQFNPLKFTSAISRDLNICENVRVHKIDRGAAHTDHGVIYAKKIIVATHFPILNKHGSYFLKMYQHRSYVIALENAPVFRDMYVDEATAGMSFSSHSGLLLLGGGGHRTGKKGGSWQELRDFARYHYPMSSERYHWAAQDCMTLDHMPYIGRYSGRTSDIYVAAGFNKWGMTSSMISAMVLCDMIQDRRNEYAEIFSPSRSILRPQLAINAIESAIGLLTPTIRRCPHLGCALKWNPHERTWDCPCHGSRFSADGKLIDNPAISDASVRSSEDEDKSF